MAEDLGEKTEEPTPKRLSEARSEGRVAKSADLTAAVLLSFAVLLLTLYSRTLFFTAQAILREALSSSLASDATVEGALEFAAFAFVRAGALVAPALLLVAAGALVVQYLQVGWLLTLKPLKPKLSQLNVVNGFKKLFNKRSAVKLAVNLAKLAVVGTLAWVVASGAWPSVVALPTLHTKAALVEALRILLRLAIWLLVAMFVIGVIDFIYQKWQHRQDLKMTKQEVKDERKASEGDTETKGRRLKMARDLLLQRLQVDVPRADVVVTNPTHFAVALRYDAQTMRAPRVLAKGADHVAIRIRLIAAAHRVPIVERPPLARALYYAVEPGQEVPVEHYEAVAEVLAYVYRLEGRAAS